VLPLSLGCIYLIHSTVFWNAGKNLRSHRVQKTRTPSLQKHPPWQPETCKSEATPRTHSTSDPPTGSSTEETANDSAWRQQMLPLGTVFTPTVAPFPFTQRKLRAIWPDVKRPEVSFWPLISNWHRSQKYVQLYLSPPPPSPCQTARCLSTQANLHLPLYTTLYTYIPPSCADCLEIWEPRSPGTLKACPGL
jgi:hypothetical protein